MKHFRYPIILMLFVMTLLLSACSGTLPATSWAGLSADQNLAYLAAGANVYAVRLNDGSMAWRYPPDKAGSGYYGAPALTSDGQLIVGGFDNILYSLNPEKGTLNWSYTPAKAENPDRWVAGALAADQAIYAPSANHSLYKLDLKGNVTSRFVTGFSLWATPATDGKHVYLPSMDHNLYAIDANTNQQVWKVDLGGAIVGAPTLSDKGVLYVGTVTKEVIAVEAATGKILWRTATSGGIWGGPAVKGDQLYIGDMSGNFYGISTADGKIAWTVKPDGPVIDSPVLVGDNQIVFGTEAGSLVAVDAAGKILWNHAINGKLYSTPVVAGDRILVAVTQGDQLLVAVDKNGNQLWTFAQPK